MKDSAGTPSSRIYFGHVAREYEATRGISDDFMSELIDDVVLMCKLKPVDLVLELGCGAGRFLRAFSSRKIPVIGIDISLGMLERAFRNQRAGNYLRSNFIASDAVAIPLNRRIFKVILVIHLFHLMTDWRDAVSETIQALKPGGSIVTGYVGAITHNSYLNQFYQQRREELGYPTTFPGAYTPEVLASLKLQGATIETHKYQTYMEVPLRVTLSYLEQRVFSSMWRNLPDIIHRQIMQDIYEAATTQYKSLDDNEQIRVDAELHYATFRG